MMAKCHDQKGLVGLMLMLFMISVMSGVGQRRTAARQPPRRRHSKPLPKKKNPLMIGRRNINRHQINFFSRQREIALGQQFAAQVDRQVRLLTDPIISEYVNRVGQNLVLHSDAADIPFTIKVVASNEVNAFALPGGFFYLNTGVLQAADTESELAGVMAHEIGHVAARHAMENMSKAQLLSFGSVPLIFLGGGVGALARSSANFGLTAALFSFSRKAEREADMLGAQYLWAAGYDPNGLLTFFEKLQRREQRLAVSPLFRTHPATPDRIAAVQRLIARFPERRDSVISSTDFARAKGRLLALSGGGRRVERTAQSGRHRRVLHRPAGGPAPDASVGPSSPSSPTGESLPHRPTLRRRPSSADGAAPAPPEPPASAPADGRALRHDPPTLRRRPSTTAPGESESSPVPDERALSPPPPVLRRQSPSREIHHPPTLRRQSPAEPPAEKRQGPPTRRRRQP